MRRREFIALVGGAVLARPLAAQAQQQPMPVVGFLSSISEEPYILAAFRRGLREQGYIEGRNVVVEYRFAEGRYERLPVLATELVSRRVNVIATVSSSPAALAAKAATQTIPIVFLVGVDVVELGLAASYNRPGGNATGVSVIVTSLTPKRLELLDALAPKSAPLAELVNPANRRILDSELKLAHEAARALGRELIVVEAATAPDIDAAFESLGRLRPGGVTVWQEAFLTSRREQIAALAQRYKLAVIAHVRQFAESGGLMSYGTNSFESNRQVGLYVGKILNGASPAELPVLQPTTYELVLNLRTAKSLGLQIPDKLLAIADEVIE